MSSEPNRPEISSPHDGLPRARKHAATTPASSIVAAGCSSSKRSNQRAATRGCRARSLPGDQAVSSSASTIVTLPLSLAVASATSRLPCWIARLKTVRGWPYADERGVGRHRFHIRWAWLPAAIFVVFLSWSRNG
jgi:hypothetical protein